MPKIPYHLTSQPWSFTILAYMADKLMEDIKESIKALVESQKGTDRMLQESKKETDRRIKETDRRIKDTERMLQESRKETDRREKETDRRIKELDELFTGQWGKLMESLVEGDLIRLLQAKGVKVDTTLQNLKKKKDGEEWELDILAIDGKEVVAVEVKTTMRVKDVDRFVQRTLGNLVEKICPEYKGKTIYGAMAYLKEDGHAAKYAEKQGLFVIRATGSSASIVNDSQFVPKSFE